MIQLWIWFGSCSYTQGRQPAFLRLAEIKLYVSATPELYADFSTQEIRIELTLSLQLWITASHSPVLLVLMVDGLRRRVLGILKRFSRLTPRPTGPLSPKKTTLFAIIVVRLFSCFVLLCCLFCMGQSDFVGRSISVGFSSRISTISGTMP